MLDEAQALTVIAQIFEAGMLPIVHFYEDRDLVTVEAVDPYDA